MTITPTYFVNDDSNKETSNIDDRIIKCVYSSTSTRASCSTIRGEELSVYYNGNLYEENDNPFKEKSKPLIICYSDKYQVKEASNNSELNNSYYLNHGDGKTSKPSIKCKNRNCKNFTGDNKES